MKDIQIQILNKQLANLTKGVDRTESALSKLSGYILNVDKPELLRDRKRLHKEYTKIGATVPKELDDVFPYSQEEQSLLHCGEESIRSLRRRQPYEIIIPIIEALQGLSIRLEKLESESRECRQLS